MTIFSFSIKPWRAVQTCTILALATLGACGGGGSSQSSSAPNSAPTSATPGVFGAIPTSGIQYQSASYSGTTNAAGEFDYVSGEEIEFSLGEMVLGRVEGAARVTEFDLAGLTQPIQNERQWIAYFDFRSHRSPLAKAANIAGILQTLDTNEDFSDGIQIMPEVADLFSANQIDLYQPYWFFTNDRRMRKLLFRAADLTDLSPRALRSGSTALQHLFSFNVSRHQRYEHDSDNDGSPNYTADYTYNSQGKIEATQIDSDGDGIINDVQYSTFNSNNVQIGQRRDLDNNGTVTLGWAQELNDFGVLTRRDEFDNTGTIFRVRNQAWDAQGALTFREKVSDSEHSIERWFFEDELLLSYEKDSDGNGVIDERQTFVGSNLNTDYDQRHLDRDADGLVDVVYDYSLNEYGRPLRITEDRGADGSIDKATEHDYNSFGEEIERRTYDDSGTLTSRYSWQFTDDGTRLGATRDADGDGNLEWRATYVKETATSPREVRFDTDGDGVDDNNNYYHYDNNGELIRWESDTDGDGVMDAVHHNIFEGSRKVRTDGDTDADGIIDQTTRYLDWITVPVTALL